MNRQQKCAGFEPLLGQSRRGFLGRFGMGLGAFALSNLLNPKLSSARDGTLAGGLHHVPKAKRVIFLFQAGGPSQMDLYDHKPLLNEMHGKQLPSEIRGEQRLTGMSGAQASLPLVGSPFKFSQHGKSGQWMSELVPHMASVADDLCFIKSMNTEAINHGPGVTFVQTGSQFPGRPSMGAWLDYGLGTANENLPSFVVLVTKNKGGQPLVSRLWGSGFLPSRHQGVRFRSGADPVLYLKDPTGLDRNSKRQMLNALDELHQLKLAEEPDPQLETRIAHYELSYRMQNSIPEATDFSDEADHVLDSYGPDARNPGSFAANCILARRLAERGVRFIQLYHQGWDHHGGLPGAIKNQCRETDQPSAALIQDLKQRGMLEDTLVIWGGEFGRTNYCQGKLTDGNFGRDHHGKCFSLWMAGGGVKGGSSHGVTDDYGYNISADSVHVHDLQATILHLLGIDHEQLTYKYQGRRFRLTDVHGDVVKQVLA
jgi:hypothetical protein